MPRRTLTVLSAAMLSAACSQGDSAPKGDALRKDAVLDARLRASSPSSPAQRGTLAAVAGAAAVCRPGAWQPKPGTAAQQARADLQLQFAREAEVAGDPRGMRDALRQAAQLDPTNHGIARRLARASEELHDVNAAVAEYCRYLALAPDATDSAVARERLQLLSSYAGARSAAPARSAATPGRVAHSAAARSRSARATRANTTVVATAPRPVTAAADSATQVASLPDTTGGLAERPSIISAPQAAASEGSERVAARPTQPAQPGAEQPTPEQPTPEQPTPEQPAPQPRRAPERINSRAVMTGAAVGAVVGSIVGRDVRSAVIGAAAGGVLGGIIGRPYSGQTYAGRTYVGGGFAGRP